jgi:hypothetical protein
MDNFLKKNNIEKSDLIFLNQTEIEDLLQNEVLILKIEVRKFISEVVEKSFFFF